MDVIEHPSRLLAVPGLEDTDWYLSSRVSGGEVSVLPVLQDLRTGEGSFAVPAHLAISLCADVEPSGPAFHDLDEAIVELFGLVADGFRAEFGGGEGEV